MERKQFLGTTLRIGAGIGLACPAFAWPDEKPSPAPGAARDAPPCGKACRFAVRLA